PPQATKTTPKSVISAKVVIFLVKLNMLKTPFKFRCLIYYITNLLNIEIFFSVLRVLSQKFLFCKKENTLIT
ncbi:MAG: hypothetical protein CVV62_00895, partial [Tenericutes bacterium HGW-Tenericutes-7]